MTPDETAACGFGHDGMCCCECHLHLIAKPRCHHLGGKGKCGDSEGGEDSPTTWVCLAFATEGIAQTDQREHGYCEMWTAGEVSR